jgi:hypothetical protein
MFFEPDEEDDFAAFSEQLTQRVEEWSRARGGAADPLVVESALEYRHRGTVDGRLGLWRERHVREFLLQWLPRTLTELPGHPRVDAPGSLRLLLAYLKTTGLTDPRGDATEVLERAVDAAAAEFDAAMGDRARWGMAKFWATTAAEQGVDVLDERAMARFSERARRGEVRVDETVLDEIMARHLHSGPPGMARAEPQLPVALPALEELRAAAERSAVVRQLAGLARWAGEAAGGRELTGRGRLRLADATELVRTLETGDRPGSPRSSAELPRLNMLFAWARQARLVRVTKGRLHAVAKARPLLDDPLGLWLRAFEALFELRETLLGDPGHGYAGTSMLFDSYEDVLPDVLNTLYSLPHPMPWPRLRDSVHLAYRSRFDLSTATANEQRRWMLHADHDLRHVLDVLEQLGALRRGHGQADPIFLDLPLDEPAVVPTLPADLPPELALLLGGLPTPDPHARERAEQLRTELTAGPVELITLSDLGTYAVRQRLLAEGRDAPLVGELAHAPAPGLLGVLAEHYDPDSARAELAGWTAAHGGPTPARELLLQAVRDTPFRTRAQAMLDVLAAVLPEGEDELMLRTLRDDPTLAPTALSVLTRREILAPDDLTDAEARLMVAEGLIQLIESTGEDAAVEVLLTDGRAPALDAITAALASGHPDRAGLDRLRSLAEGPLRTRAAQLGRLRADRTRRHSAKAGRRRRK